MYKPADIYVHRRADIRTSCGLQVKRMTDGQRLLLARMIVADGDRDEDETRKLFDICMKTLIYVNRYADICTQMC